MKSINCIAAMDSARGIGKNNTLPWRLRNELHYFTKITSDSTTEGKNNLVVMGRNTWQSIPKKHRPLSGRINVVMSKTMSASELPENVLLRSDLSSLIKEASEGSLADQVEDIYIIGGQTLYKEAMQLECCKKLFITHVNGDFSCDTFYPEFDETVFPPASDPRVPTEEQEENGIKYRFSIYERILS